MDPATSAPAPWVVFDYEVQMLYAMCSLLQDPQGQREARSQDIRNAIVESALLHLRNLVDIILSRGSEADDIKLRGLLPVFEPARLGDLRAAYGDSKKAGTPCWTLNKMMAHPTTHRGSSYEYAPLLEKLVPIVRDIIKEVRTRRT